jgi:pyrroloquinoline quinone biosynthesis protein B
MTKTLLPAFFIIAACTLLATACAGLSQTRAPVAMEPRLDGPYVLALGNAQDAGFPQIGAEHPAARRAFEDASRRRFTTSLLIVDPRQGRRWLIDASPDLRDQVEFARGHPPRYQAPQPASSSGDSAPTGRPPLFDGVFLTHAHMGHYLGLAHFGREAYGARDLPVYASPKMCLFLEQNAPWSQLVELRNIRLHALADESSLDLAPDLRVRAWRVPHRGEFTDTMAFLVEGPERSLIYLPDIDKWEHWDRRIEDVIEGVDYALLDGTFYADGEIPGRAMDEIPHPFVAESMARLAVLPPDRRARVRFTHFNHTNPLLDPDDPARAELRTAGFGIVEQGERFDL